MYTLLIFAFMLTVVSTFASKICDGSKNVEWRRDPTDCSSFYLCFGTLEHKYSCKTDQVYDEKSQSCVPKGSPQDICSKKSDKPTYAIENEKCTSVFLTDGENCAKYFDCTLNSIQECPYPLLFDEDIKRCVPPEKANCGSRTAVKDPCDYEEFNCRSSMGCVPCHVRFPSCKGLPDGLNPWVGREESPYFAVCSNERVVYHDMCDFENKNEIFNRQKLACESMYK